MNLSKLFETQRVLDARIMASHPELKGQNNLAWKILALLVELGECANEWRGFKKWSNNQEPRREVEKIGFANPGGPFTYKKYPLLEEYVDCLHFILSIGIESGWSEIDFGLEYKEKLDMGFSYKDTSLTRQFTNSFYFTTKFEDNSNSEGYIDIVLCFCALGEMLGFTWEQIEQAYYDKNAVNHSRQENGY